MGAHRHGGHGQRQPGQQRSPEDGGDHGLPSHQGHPGAALGPRPPQGPRPDNDQQCVEDGQSDGHPHGWRLRRRARPRAARSSSSSSGLI